ncbi:restriction endonuclease subunit S [Rhizobium etli]|uniref:restriction endonuclease subunit S n=1 Tax=Rhizobium etli TaxID=29449 RepID=UPI0003839092|nr:restriction endonuclease subunit S [Rhizobium etli]AGS23871.1 type I restriction-modification system subunit HsdS-like protein [Rhizobium etli bv. mimosae str. Mim1]
MSRKVPEGWVEYTFGDVLDFKGGTQPPKETFLYEPTPGFVRLLQIRDFEHDEKPAYIPETVRSSRCTESDILIARYGASLGRVLRGKAGAYNVALVKIMLLKQDIEPNFVYYWLSSEIFQSHLRSVGNRSAQEGFNKLDLSPLPIFLPPLPEQRRIAEILSSVDDAIAATRAVIEQTRKVKQGVLERLLTKGIGHTRFKQTEIGEIPETWEVGRIGNIGEVMVGRQRSPSFTEGSDFAYLRVANVFDNLIDTSDVLKMKFTDGEVERYLLRAGDILLNEGQSLHLVGRNARYEGNPSACCFQNTLIRFRARESTDLDYAFALMQFLFFKGRFSEIATQTTSVAHLGSNRFAALLVPVPPLEEQREIGRLHNSLLETETLQKSQLDQSLLTKSALMSDLLTGRKRVTEALPMAAE